MNNNQNNTSINNFSSEDQIDIKPMLKTLYRGKKYLFGIPLITSIIVAIFSLFEVPVWRGNFQIVIGNSNDKGNDLIFCKATGK